MIKLIALDLDGTLLDPSGRITEPSRQPSPGPRPGASMWC